MTQRGNLVLGLVCAALAILTLAVWIPQDVDSGLIEKVRRRVAIGDALAPSVAAVLILLGGVMTAAASRGEGDGAVPDRALRFGAAMLGVLVAGFLVMLHAGPLAVWLFVPAETGGPSEYRLLRASFPWKYIGFVLGGTVSITGCVALVEGRLTGRAVLVSLGAVLAMIALFDLPFEDLLLPPNGDY